MLANLLPGLRHTRTPLIAGALWLLIAWLLLGHRLTPDANGGRIERLSYDLGDLIGKTALLAGLALLATLLGGMAPRLPVRAIARRLPINSRGRWWQGPLCLFFGLEPDLADARGEYSHWLHRRASLAPADLEWSAFSGKECPPVLQVASRDIRDSGSARIGREILSESDFAGDPPIPPYDWLKLSLAEASLRQEVDSELPLQLQAARETLFNEYDRVRSESELRAAIVIPLVVLIAVLVIGASWLWALAIAIPVWLLRQAVQSYVDAEQRLLSAVRYGIIPSSTIRFIDSLSPIGQNEGPD